MGIRYVNTSLKDDVLRSGSSGPDGPDEPLGPVGIAVAIDKAGNIASASMATTLVMITTDELGDGTPKVGKDWGGLWAEIANKKPKK